MKKRINFKNTVILFTLISLVSLVNKGVQVGKYYDSFYTDTMFDISYQFFFKTTEDNTSIKTFIPKNNDRQRISAYKYRGTIDMQQKAFANNIKAIWTTNTPNIHESLEYQFTFEGKEKIYSIPETFITYDSVTAENYLLETKNIQSDHPRITVIIDSLKKYATTDRQLMRGIYDIALAIPEAPIITLSDALTVLDQKYASCNGKTRLLIALSRNAGIPARMKGGLILEETSKRTSHSWAEVFINGNWIPFDALNDHFGYIPANYMELYEGDQALITHTKGMTLNYNYTINEKVNIPFLRLSASQFSDISPISLWELVDNKTISTHALTLLLMLPLGGLLVAFLRNVVGLQTFGVFLPVLIAFSLVETGYFTGILLFIFLILLVGLISRPFQRLGLLHTPKLVVSLTLMVLIMIFGSYIGLRYNMLWLTSLTLFPTIILTVSAERFSTLIVEDGFEKATGTLFQTLIAVTVCYTMLSSQYMSFVIILFPEILFVIIVIALLLGRYIGLRWTELLRFKPLLFSKNSAHVS